MERKEELQDQCQSLKRLLEKESGTAAGLKGQLISKGNFDVFKPTKNQQKCALKISRI